MRRHFRRSFISQIYLLQSVLVPGCVQGTLSNPQQTTLKLFSGLGCFAEILLSFCSLDMGVVYHRNYWLLCKSVKLFKSLPRFLFLNATYKEAKSWLKALHVHVFTKISAHPSADEDPDIFKHSSVTQAYRTRSRHTEMWHFHYRFGSNLWNWLMQISVYTV